MTRVSSSRLRARLIQLAELTAPEAAKLARSPKVVVILPLGAIEQHGPHLPLLVDWRGAEELAYGIAPHLARAGWSPVLAPPIPYGVSTLAVGWPGTVSLTVATLCRLVVEVVSGLASHGFRRVVLTNYQADPDHLLAIAAARRELARRELDVADDQPESPSPAAKPQTRGRMALRGARDRFLVLRGEPIGATADR